MNISQNPHYVVENEIPEDEFFLSQQFYINSRALFCSREYYSYLLFFFPLL